MGGVGAAIAGGLASGIGGAMMSGGDGGGTSAARIPRYTKGQLELLKLMTDELTSEVGEGVEAWPQDTVPGPTALQQGAAGYGETYLEDVLGAKRERGMELLEGEEWQPERVKEHWRKSVLQPSQRAWEQEAAPQLMEQYAGRGALDSSAMAQALAESRQEMELGAQEQLSNLMFESWQQHQGRQLERAQLGQSMLGQTLQEAGGLYKLGGGPRGIEQAQRAEERAKWLYEQSYRNPWLQSYLGTVLGASPYRVSQSSQGPSAGYQIGKGLFGAGLRGIGSGLGSMWGGGGGGGYTPSMGTPQKPYGV